MTGRNGDAAFFLSPRPRVSPSPRLNIIPDCSLEVRSVVSAQGELLAVFHDDAIFTVKPRLHLLDLVNLDNRGTMNSPELPRIELVFQTADRLAQEVSLLIVVNAHVVPFSLNAVNILDVQEENTASVFDYQPFKMTRSAL